MYTPMKFVEQVKSQIQTPEDRRIEGVINRRSIEYFSAKLNIERDESLGKYIVGYTTQRNGIDEHIIKGGYDDIVRADANKYSAEVGVLVPNLEDYCHMALMTTTTLEWSMNKKVYLLEQAMGETLYHMQTPNDFLMEVMMHLPSKCFYLDYRESHIFGDEIIGTMVEVTDYIGYRLIHFLHLIDKGFKVMMVVQDLAFKTNGERLTAGNILDDIRPVELEDGSYVGWSDTRFTHFFANFCLYLNAVNNDVEYTQMTKQAYKPRKPGAAPTNRMREVEEFGVGFRYSTIIAKGRKVTYYSGDSCEERAKRGYSSHYRNAHWHHYWVNDSESPDGKRRIIKWIDGVFVKGNKESDTVVVHVVKENRDGKQT